MQIKACLLLEKESEYRSEISARCLGGWRPLGKAPRQRKIDSLGWTNLPGLVTSSQYLDHMKAIALRYDLRATFALASGWEQTVGRFVWKVSAQPFQ